MRLRLQTDEQTLRALQPLGAQILRQRPQHGPRGGCPLASSGRIDAGAAEQGFEPCRRLRENRVPFVVPSVEQDIAREADGQ